MTCTATRHTAGAYHNSRCHCAVGRRAHRLQVKLRQAGLNRSHMIDVTGTRRRVEGLLAMGWPGDTIAKAAGLPRQTRASSIAANPKWVTVETAQAVRRAVELLGGTPGPCKRARGQARRCGYVPLWAWDEDTIDNPASRPVAAGSAEVVDEVAVERAVQAARTGQRRSVKLNKTELRTVVAKLASAPYWMHDNAIAAGMGKSYSWVTATRDRAGVPRVVVRAAPGRRAA